MQTPGGKLLDNTDLDKDMRPIIMTKSRFSIFMRKISCVVHGMLRISGHVNDGHKMVNFIRKKLVLHTKQ